MSVESILGFKLKLSQILKEPENAYLLETVDEWDSFADIAVQLGATYGYHFTNEEFEKEFSEFRSRFKELKPGGELNDDDLDSINGGVATPASQNCFISTACLNARGLGDNSSELNMLRYFRDSYLAIQPGGSNMIEEYYLTAPQIVKNINSNPLYNEIYNSIFNNWLSDAIEFVKSGKNTEAFKIYTDMFNTLKKKYQ
jgi:hypothetical protein